MSPLRNLVLVERLPALGAAYNDAGEIVSAGGIIMPQAFRRQHPTDKHKVQPDLWRGRVEAVGPRAAHDLRPGDEVVIQTWAGDNGKGLYTGVDADTGQPATPQSRRVLVEYPDDFVCALERDSDAPEEA